MEVAQGTERNSPKKAQSALGVLQADILANSGGGIGPVTDLFGRREVEHQVRHDEGLGRLVNECDVFVNESVEVACIDLGTAGGWMEVLVSRRNRPKSPPTRRSRRTSVS